MSKRYIIFSLFIFLHFIGFIISVQSDDGYFLLLNGGDGCVVDSKVSVVMIIFSMGDPLPLEPDTITFKYDPEILAVDTEKGNNGVEIKNVYKQLEVDSSIPGELNINVVYFNHITHFRIHFLPLKTGTSPITATIVPAPLIQNTYDIQNTEVKIVDYGDVNADSSIDILDALLTAQVYVEIPVDFFIKSAAYVNCDGSINILDALLMAQYCVQLIDEFPLCNGTPTPIPTPDPTPEVTPVQTSGTMLGDINGTVE